MKTEPFLMGGTCPECGKGQLFLIYESEEFDYELGDEKLRVKVENVPLEKCDQCGEVIAGTSAFRLRHDAICRTAGFYTPSEIRELRENLGLSQTEFAQLAGVGTATVSRWERGRLLQNRGNDNLLFLLTLESNRKLLQERAASRTNSNLPTPSKTDTAQLPPFASLAPTETTVE